MKKYLILLLALFLIFGFSSTTLANDNHHQDDSSKEKVTYHKGYTTIVTTTKKVKHDSIVKVDQKADYYTEKKQKQSSFNKTDMVTTTEYHPVHDWFRYIDVATTYKIIKYETWDQVKKVTTYKTKTTPVKIAKTTIRTEKYRGKPGKLGKKVSDSTEVYIEKTYGKPQYKTEEKVEFFNKNYKTSYDKEVIDVKKTYGKWNKGDWKEDKGKDKGKGKQK